ncbi:uncharacterized protein LOC117217832 isoform X9 [Megalopta genalis]|uniref:uncharacterized protein LOC117217832 isoform X9 n=1 Tax=Megalopta genalis TaxID=115081 RepID=UPI003FD06397
MTNAASLYEMARFGSYDIGVLLLLLLLLSVAGVSADIASDSYNYMLLIEDVHNYYGTTCIIIVRSNQCTDMNETTVTQIWTRSFSRSGILTVIVGFSDLAQETKKYEGCEVRPLYVVLLSTKKTLNEFATATGRIDISFPVWFVMFLPHQGDPLKSDCRSPTGNLFNLSFDTEMLVLCYDQPSLREWYSFRDNRTTVSNLAVWKPGQGLWPVTNGSLYARRNNLRKEIMRIAYVEVATIERQRRDQQAEEHVPLADQRLPAGLSRGHFGQRHAAPRHRSVRRGRRMPDTNIGENVLSLLRQGEPLRDDSEEAPTESEQKRRSEKIRAESCGIRASRQRRSVVAITGGEKQAGRDIIVSRNFLPSDALGLPRTIDTLYRYPQNEEEASTIMRIVVDQQARLINRFRFVPRGNIVADHKGKLVVNFRVSFRPLAFRRVSMDLSSREFLFLCHPLRSNQSRVTSFTGDVGKLLLAESMAGDERRLRVVVTTIVFSLPRLQRQKSVDVEREQRAVAALKYIKYAKTKPRRSLFESDVPIARDQLTQTPFQFANFSKRSHFFYINFLLR